jgi:hypothetical protein
MRRKSSNTAKLIIAAIVVVVVGTLAGWHFEVGPFAVKQDEASNALRKAFTGNTIAYAGKGRGGNTTIFYGPDGRMKAVTATVSTPLEGTWRTKAPGQFCQRYDGRDEACNKVVLDNEVAKFHNDDGKLQFEAKILPGNQIKLPEPRKK